MANIRITDLTAYTDAASTDVLPIVDVSNNVTKKVSISDLLKAVPLGSAAAPAIAIDGDPNTGIYSPGADTLAFVEGGTEAMRIDSSGNVGIGTSSPAYRLDVAGSIRSTGGANALRLENIANNGVYALFTRPNQEYRLALNINNNGERTFDIYDNTNLHFVDQYEQGASGYRRFFTNGTERARIDSSGNVGIGTSSPGAILHTVNTSAGAATVGAFIQNSSLTAGTEVRLGFAPNTNVVGDNRYSWIGAVNGTGSNDSSLTFATAPGGADATERMRIDSSGRVGIGTSSPTTLLDVNANTIRVRTARTPASASATGATGEICWDANYIYVCTATNTWKRTAISTW